MLQDGEILCHHSTELSEILQVVDHGMDKVPYFDSSDVYDLLISYLTDGFKEMSLKESREDN